ncbi:hypothetical protein BG011_009580 [Mortierella polycephala]|uniref:Protein kinase domain-containing protein n=1 Tax=Mortierella polycephala TaxID=41804 RepID=A0A9P6QBU8_9FUNG|nr:hypothetical protein BG011_009580 [Mortierella polycephala]
MLGTPTFMLGAYHPDDPYYAGSIKSGKSEKSEKSGKSGKNGKNGKGGKSKENSDSFSSPTDSLVNYSTNTNKTRSGSISSVTSGVPPSPTVTIRNNTQLNDHNSMPGLMSSLAEEEMQPSLYASQPPTPTVEEYQQCMQWLQQNCRPVFMKELAQVSDVPVLATEANARHPNQIDGTRHVQIAHWKQSQVQLVPFDRWGQPQEVLAEIQALHKLRKCRQIIQLYGYLPSAILPSGQGPALLLQQPKYGSLRQFIDHHFDSIQWPERYRLALDMTQGLRYLTLQDIPCSLHPGSILVDAEGVAILTGFGPAAGMITSSPCQMTAQPSVSALVAYMAPEKLIGKSDYSSDWGIYSLGILFWELSSGRPPFEEIITRAENGPRLAKNMEQLSSAIVKGLREESVPRTPEIYEQLFQMCWDMDTDARPPLEVIEETLQMLVMVEPMDMHMLSDEDMSMNISAVVSDSIDGDSLSTHTDTRSNSTRSVSPSLSSQTRMHMYTRPTTLHQAISVSNADMTEWFILSGQDMNGYAIVPTYSLECEITPIQTCLGHFLPSSLPILKELMDQDADTKLLAKRSLHNCLHVLFDRYLPVKNENGPAHLFAALDMLLEANVPVNAQDVQGYTPLHLLMRNPKISSEDVVEVMKRMVAKGADTSITCPQEGNVLALAAKYLHFEATKWILNDDITASDSDSIDWAIEACMTMTGRQTDNFVNLRTKVRELLKLWTGKAGETRKEKLVLRVLCDAGQLDSTGFRYKKGKVVRLAPQAQLDYANIYYDTHIKKKRERMFDYMGFIPALSR